MNHLVKRLKKEKCDVYTISGKRSKEKAAKLPPHNIFEFSSGGLDVKYIMQCVQPDTIIFMGALDDGYDWNHEMIAADYNFRLTNILVWAKACQIKHFVYLSTIAASQAKKSIIYDGEFLCKRYDEEKMKVTILRFPVVYGPTHFIYEKLNAIEEMCFDAKDKQEIKPMDYQPFMAVYVSDAVDAIYKAAVKRTCAATSYLVEGYESVSDEKIAKLLTPTDGQPIRVGDYEGERTELSLDGTAFKEEFQYSPLIAFETGLQRTNKYVEEHYKELKEKRTKEETLVKEGEKENLKENIRTVFKKIKRAAENLAMFAIALALTYFCGSMDMFEGVDFMLIYILIAAISFGVGHSVMAAVLSVCGIVFLKMHTTGWAFTTVLSQYSTIFQLLFYLILALMVSYSIQRYKLSMKVQDERMEDIQEEYELIYDVNKTNVEIKKVFEDRLLGYGDSIGKIYNIVSELDVLEPEKIETASLGVVKKIMHVKDVCIYKTGGEGYYHFVDATTTDARAMKKAIRLHDYPKMEQPLENGDIFINHEIDGELPRMAAPIYSEGVMIYIIMLWNMDFEQLNTYQKNLFLVLAKIITSSLEKGYQYEKIGRYQKYYENTDVLFPEIFMERVRKRLKGVSKDEAEYSLIQVEMGDYTLEEISMRLKELTRDGDKMGKVSDEDSRVYVLLHAGYADAEYVINKFKKNGLTGKAVVVDEI